MIAAQKKRGKIPLPKASEGELHAVAGDLVTFMPTLSKQQLRRLETLEGKLERAGKTLWDAAFEWGDTLQAIYDEGLWAGSHSTWEAYCLDRWGISKSNASRQMTAAAKYKTVAPVAKKLGLDFTCESQMRPLINVPDEDIPHVMRRAKRLVAGKRITAEVIARAVKEENTSPDDLKSEWERQRERASHRTPPTSHATPDSSHRTEMPVRTGLVERAESAVVDIMPDKLLDSGESFDRAAPPRAAWTQKLSALRKVIMVAVNDDAEYQKALATMLYDLCFEIRDRIVAQSNSKTRAK